MCQDVFTLGELHQAMNTFFPVSTSGLMKQFWTEKKLPSQSLMDYYFNKLKLAKILNISSEQTLEALSSNVNAKLRPFLIAANPANLDMWIKIASSLEEGFRHEETSSPFNGPRYRRDFQNIDSRNATPSQDSLPSGARPGREVGDRQETRRKQFYQDFRDNEEEDLERCLGVEPNKQASTDSPQVLFSSIKNPDHPTEPLEKLLLVSVDTQTESEPVRFKNKNVAFGAVEKDTKKRKWRKIQTTGCKNSTAQSQQIRPESWIKLYDFENNSLKEDEKIKNLMYYLTDSALEWYADEIISNPAIKRWEVVKEKLIQRFGSYNANPIVSASHRRLKREESIENYFQDKICLLNQTHLTKEEKIHLLTDGLPNDWKDLIVAAQPTDATKWFHIAASIEQNRASIQFKPKNKIHLATKNNDNRKNVCPFWCPICSKKGIKIKHWVTDCEDYDPHYKKDRPNQNTSVKQVCGAPELLNVSTLTNTPTQGAFKLINRSVEVNGIPAQAFVDTGATVSIINWRLFKRTRLQLQPNSDIHISQADGVTRTCGSLQTKVRIDKLIKPVTLHVMKNFKYPLLIGLDVASLFNLLIDVRDKTIYTKFDGLQNPILVNHLEEIREHELKKLLEHNRNVFCQHAIDLGKVAIQHKIITKSEQPISLRPYRRPLKEYEEIAEQVKELLEHKLIRISDSPWAFPVVMVPKKDGNKRMCIDYRRLNEITLDDRQPLPHIQDMFDRLHGSRFFSTLDVAWGYWQIEIDPQYIQKTAFVTNDGHYEFLVMPFGLKNAASTFQRIIQHILGELLWKGTCSFQDDILVYRKTWQEHIELLSKVFDKLRQYNMKLKLSKCIFGRTEVKYLGHIISHNQLKPDPGKVKSIQDFPRPDTVKKVRQFMGLANYYRKFVKDFSKISFPLVRLTRKNQPFIWNEEVEESFAKLKMALSTKPVLAIYNPDYPSKVYTDASKYGIGAILTQIGPDNEEHVQHEPTLGEMITPTSNIQPLQMIGCDTIVLGTAAANTNHKFIQVFVDHATRYLWAYPTITNTAQAVTQCLDKIIKSVNSINTILTDSGKNFISKEFNKFLSLQGIKHTYTSPYHPQCNGICEKLNDTIMTKLRIAVLEKPRCKWSTLLPQVVKNYNSTPDDVTGFSPLFLMYGIGNVPEFADQTPITIEEARKKASLRTEQSR
ncbi:K02A2.6-like, partial [Cordylochernes scorpioides]